MQTHAHRIGAAMAVRHYAKLISTDGPDVVGLLNQELKLI